MLCALCSVYIHQDLDIAIEIERDGITYKRDNLTIGKNAKQVIERWGAKYGPKKKFRTVISDVTEIICFGP